MAANESQMTELERRPPTFEGRLLAEAVRAFERHHAEPLRDGHAEHRTLAQGEDLESRIVARAAALPVAQDLKHALHRVGQSVALALIAATVIAAIAGAAAARAALAAPRGEPVNIFWAIGGLLGIQLLLLLAWVVLMMRGTAALASSSLGGIVLAAARWLGRRSRADSVPGIAAAIDARGATTAGGSVGRWTFSAISHWFWVLFNLSCLAMLLAMLSTRHYTFMWETTILGERTFAPATRAIAWLPEKLGFAVPDSEQIAAARWPVAPKVTEDDRESWAGLLVGSIVAYGLAPRIVLLLLSLWRRDAAKRAFRLDLNAPEYVRLQPLLSPASSRLGVIDDDDRLSIERADTAPRMSEPRPIGPAAVLGLELQRPPSPWPPRLVSDLSIVDLGRIDDARSRHGAIRALRESNSAPRVVIVIAELTTTPDRGHQSFLAEVRAAAGRPIALILTAGEALRQRGERELLEHRVEDWRAAANVAGIADENVYEIDLHHLTDETAARMRQIARPGEDVSPDRRQSAAATRRIEPAFNLIAEHADRWRGGADVAARAELHRAIAALYRHERADWTRFLRIDETTKREWRARLHAGADRVTSLLPAGLKLDPRWLAAGAAAGALGCVAAAAVLSPAAIVSLPMWSGLGALISEALKPRGVSIAADQIDDAPSDLGEAIRSAALFAMLLELQGRGEASITRVLERAIAPGLAGAELRNAADVRNWLDQLRHSFDLALTLERSA